MNDTIIKWDQQPIKIQWMNDSNLTNWINEWSNECAVE